MPERSFGITPFTAPVVVGQIVGLGPLGYLLALEAIKVLVEQSHK